MAELNDLAVNFPLNFFAIEEEYSAFDKSKFIVIQAPFEGTVSYGQGTAAGPAAILKASQQVELFDEITGKEHIPERGVCTLKPIDVTGGGEAIFERLYNLTRQVVKAGKTPILIGGEHSVTPGTFKAIAEEWPDLGVLQIDAHSDMRDVYQGDKYSHACAAARMNELAPIVQVGVRSRERFETGHPDRPVTTYHGHEIANSNTWIDEAIGKLPRNVYLTIDVDGFDPSVFPGTGTPEPGGLGWYQGLELNRKLAMARNIVGFDIVEVAPIEGQQVSEFAAARLMSRVIAFISEYCWNTEGGL
ncbi:MAG: agmatinase [Planctomycetes bacterium]|nr:agmatinase [Planctomycetota bacterium]